MEGGEKLPAHNDVEVSKPDNEGKEHNVDVEPKHVEQKFEMQGEAVEGNSADVVHSLGSTPTEVQIMDANELQVWRKVDMSLSSPTASQVSNDSDALSDSLLNSTSFLHLCTEVFLPYGEVEKKQKKCHKNCRSWTSHCSLGLGKANIVLCLETVDLEIPFGIIHASDSPGMILVNNTFDGKGYQDSPDLPQWNRYNDMMFKQMKMEKASQESVGSEINNNAVAGTIFKYTGSCFSILNSESWIIDSDSCFSTPVKLQALSFNALSIPSQVILKSVFNIFEPSSYKSTSTHLGWKKAMEAEIEALKLNHTCDVVPLPQGRKALSCKWIYKVKQHANGTIKRLKAMQVIRGDIQKERIDLNETFSPVFKITTIRCLIAIAANKQWEIFQFDVNNAFLQGDLQEEVYIKFPAEVYPPSPNMFCRLKKSLYGLKQASRKWYARLAGALNYKGFTASLNIYSLFFKKEGDSITIFAVYVDDVLITGDAHREIANLKKFLHSEFHIKNLGTLHYFGGMEILREAQGIIVNQKKYTLDLLEELDVSQLPSVSSLLDPTVTLTSTTSDLLDDPTSYRYLIGKLNSLTHSRPDLCHVVLILSQFIQQPSIHHYNAALRVLRYLKNFPNQGLFLSSLPLLSLNAFCDAEWDSCRDSRGFISRFFISVGGSLISWKSKKQVSVSLFSAKVGYRSMRRLVAELTWLTRFLPDLSVPSLLSVPVHSNS
ncbi:hypothetical protein FXO38_23894 [Capsicum annuum]|nr:hypothetical protein FXO38_23894 [Capsicum annuum]